MKGIWKELLATIGIDWVLKVALLSGLRALRELVTETDTVWDDKVVLPVLDAVIARLNGDDVTPFLEAAKPELERFASL